MPLPCLTWLKETLRGLKRGTHRSKPPKAQPQAIRNESVDDDLEKVRTASTGGKSVESTDKPVQRQQKPQTMSITATSNHRSYDAEMIWRDAYDGLRHGNDTAELVARYEYILDKTILGNAHDLDPYGKATAPAEGLLTGEALIKRMGKLGLERIDKAKARSEACGSVLEWATALQTLLEPVLSSNVYTGIPCAVVSATLEILIHPTKVTNVLYTGVEIVVEKMTWYSSLAERLLTDDTVLPSLHSQMKDRLVNLYKAILQYQMKSICSFYRSQVVVILRSMVFADDWPGELQAVMDAEASVCKDMEQFRGSKSDDLMSRFVASQEAARNHEKQYRQAKEERDCLIDLQGVNSRMAMIDLELHKKDILLPASFVWILHNEKYKEFAKWQDPQSPKQLWISGQAGRGKTMLLIGIIRHLADGKLGDLATPDVAYYFCQADNHQMNTAVAVLRGLIWLLAQQQPHLIKYALDTYRHSGAKAFDDTLSFTALSDILVKMLADPNLQPVVLVIDALDECEDGSRERLIKTIVRCSDLSSQVKWLVSSRPLPEIELKLQGLHNKLDLRLDEVDLRVPIKAYIDYQIGCLNVRVEQEEKHRSEVKKALHDRAGNTFLWVWLVCQVLSTQFAPLWMEMLEKMPKDLQQLYGHLLERLDKLELPSVRLDCQRVLGVAALAFRPLTVAELEFIVQPTSKLALKDIVSHCGSFLSRRAGHVHLIHKSAQDYLIENFTKIESGGTIAVHDEIASSCIGRMTNSRLEKNICEVANYGTTRSEIDTSSSSRLDAIRYACQFWVPHLQQASRKIHDNSEVYQFLERKFLPWLEALSWIEGMSRIIHLLEALQSLILRERHSANISWFLEDAMCFVLANFHVIDSAPRQAYASAMIFAPQRSIIRTLFRGDIPEWLDRLPDVRAGWNPDVLWLTGHKGFVTSIAFPANSDQLVSASIDGEVKLWNLVTATPRCWKIIDDDVNIRKVTISPDCSLLASSSKDNTIKIWSAKSGLLQSTLTGHDAKITALAFLNDNSILISTSFDKATKPWNLTTGAIVMELERHLHPVNCMAVSLDSTKLASASLHGTVKIWSTKTWDRIDEVRCERQESLLNIRFLPDSTVLATISEEYMMKYWHTGSRRLIKERFIQAEALATPKCAKSGGTTAISPNGGLVAYANFLSVWLGRVHSGMDVQRFRRETHSNNEAVEFSPDGRLLAAANDSNIRLWSLDAWHSASRSTGTKINVTPHETHASPFRHARERKVRAIAISFDCALLASSTVDGVRLWSLQSKWPYRRLSRSPKRIIQSLAFSPDCKVLASGSGSLGSEDYDFAGCGEISAWDMSTYNATLLSHNSKETVIALTFSASGKFIASMHENREIYIQGVAYEDAFSLLATPLMRLHHCTTIAYHDDELKVFAIKYLEDAIRVLFDAIDDAPSTTSGPYATSGDWIARGAEKLFWLPFEYRHVPCAFGRDCVFFGMNGVVEMIQFQY